MSILENVQRTLQLYAGGITDLSFTEAAAHLSLPKSSASHLLNQMVRYGLLDQHPVSRRYRAGALLGQAAQAAYAATPLDVACREVLERLSEHSGLTAYLSTLVDAETVVLQRLNGSFPVQVLSSPGSRRAAAGTAMGRALLSRLSPAEFENLYGLNPAASLPASSQAGLRTVANLAQCVTQATLDRHALVIDGAMPGIGAVAAAVRNPQDGELRGLCISFVSSLQAGSDKVDALRHLVLDEVSALGRRLNDGFWLSDASAPSPSAGPGRITPGLS